MKFLNAIIAFILFNPFFHSQVIEKFSDGNFLINPQWKGSISDFIVNSSDQLQSYNTIPSISFLTTAHNLSSLDNKEWRYWVKLAFSPSANNNTRIYLTSENNDLSINPNGFFLQLGETGALDAIRLMKSENGVETEICSGPEGMISSAFAVSVKVIRDSIGNWKLYIDPSGGDDYSNLSIGYDSTLVIGSSTGVYCKYSISNTSKFYFDNIYVGNIEYDTLAPSIESVQVIYNQQLDVLFNESLDNSSVNNYSNYTLDPLTTISGAQLDISNSKLVHLSLSTPLENGKDYVLETNNINDLEGNNKNDSILFTYRVAELPSRGDIIFTEVMSDPSPSFGLPEVEYVEIYNRSQKYFNLDNWILADATSTGIINAGWLNPGEYKIICSSTNSDEYPTGISCSSFPNLNNSGDYIRLSYSDGTLIDDLTYSSDWIEDINKEDGGFSFERKSITLNCFKKSNWGTSIAVSGGTPGEANSLNTLELDSDHPTILSGVVKSDSLLEIVFNEPVDSVSIMENDMFISNGVIVEYLFLNSQFSDTLTIQITKNLQAGKEYEIELEGVRDCSNNTSNLTVKFVLPQLADKGDVIINEILFNPQEGGGDYLEVYNSSDKNIDLKGWKIGRLKEGVLEDEFQVTSNFILKPDAYLVFSEDTQFIINNYPKSLGGDFSEMDLPRMNNDSGTVVLSSKDFVVDQVSYQSSWHLYLLDDEKGKALERIDPFGESNSYLNWRTASEEGNFGSPSYRNSQARSTERNAELFKIAFETITPNNDGAFDYLEITYTFEEAALLGTFTIFDKTGRKIKTVFENKILGTEGILVWDIVNEEQQLVSSGTYIAVLEAFSENGNENVLKKKAFVVYSTP